MTEEKRLTLAQLFDVSKIDRSQMKKLSQERLNLEETSDPASDQADSIPETPEPIPESSQEESPEDEADGSVIPGFIMDQMMDAMLGQLGEMLSQVDVVGDVLGTAWGKAAEIKEYLSPDYPPEEVNLVPLIEHEVAYEHSPTIEPKFKQKSLGEVVFDIALTFALEGVILEIQGGKITKLHVGACKGLGTLGTWGNQLLELPEQVIEALKGAIHLEDGIQIGGKREEPEPVLETTR